MKADLLSRWWQPESFLGHCLQGQLNWILSGYIDHINHGTCGYQSKYLVPLVQFSLYDNLESKINILTLVNTCVLPPTPHSHSPLIHICRYLLSTRYCAYFCTHYQCKSTSCLLPSVYR